MAGRFAQVWPPLCLLLFIVVWFYPSTSPSASVPSPASKQAIGVLVTVLLQLTKLSSWYHLRVISIQIEIPGLTEISLRCCDTDMDTYEVSRPKY
jgi:hypothetical protein